MPVVPGPVRAHRPADAVWYDAVVRKVRKNDVEVFYPEDNATRRHNLLVSGEEDYMARGTRWKLKK